MRIGRRDRSTRRKLAPVPFCPPQIPHDLTQAAAVESRRLTGWAMARPIRHHYKFIKFSFKPTSGICSGGKSGHTYTEFIIRKDGYTMSDVPWFQEQMDFNSYCTWTLLECNVEWQLHQSALHFNTLLDFKVTCECLTLKGKAFSVPGYIKYCDMRPKAGIVKSE
jgi:hypothetical protein